MIQSKVNISDIEIHDALKEIFGYSEFRPNQIDIIKAILNKDDAVAIMPTGGGKSMCYQLPAYLMEGTTIVISPLISLMKDQVDAACAMGLKAAYINSTLTSLETSEIHSDLLQGELDLLYVSPERFAMEPFIQSLKDAPLNHFAIDEAHCISDWGHDFRPDYMNLAKIIKEFSHLPVSAYTATATENVQNDIVSRLKLRNPFIVRASFDRENLFYTVKPKESINSQITDYIKKHKEESGIIYRTTRKGVEETAQHLINKGIKCLPYHAGLSNDKRSNSQEQFNRDRVQVIVATIAFGMGIDKSNVRYVIHGDLPKNKKKIFH
jgi:ATP-dependent DNA helicase RecQ